MKLLESLFWKPTPLPRCYQISTIVTRMAIEVRVGSTIGRLRTMGWSVGELGQAAAHTATALSHVFEIFGQMARVS